MKSQKPISRRDKKVFIRSLGCPKNLVDAEVMAGLLERAGYEIVAKEHEAAAVVINTCAFIREAQTESVEQILEAAKLKEDGACRRLVVTGCLPQRYGGSLQEEIPEVDAWLGVGAVGDIAQALAGEEKGAVNLPPLGGAYNESWPRFFNRPQYSAYVRISEGCDNRCSYCLIPDLRGPLRSRTLTAVEAEARRLAEEGVKEVILIGQDVTAYGKDRREEFYLERLLARLVKIRELAWIRILYAHPAHVSERLIDLIAGEEKICPYLDIPLQHIDDEILKAMRRPYRRREVEKLLAALKKKIPEIALRTTMLVGFPGETEARFKSLLQFIRQAGFDHLGAFAYSPESGTPAAEFPDAVPLTARRRRRHRLLKAQQEVSRKRMAARVGKVYPALIEGLSDESDLMLQGRLIIQAPEVDGRLYITGGEAEIGSIAPVRIKRGLEYDLIGEAVE